jgi:hypothetical protein
VHKLAASQTTACTGSHGTYSGDCKGQRPSARSDRGSDQGDAYRSAEQHASDHPDDAQTMLDGISEAGGFGS